MTRSRTKGTLLWFIIGPAVAFGLLFLMTGGVYVEHFSRYLPDTSSTEANGAFAPMFSPQVESKKIPIIPYLLYFVPVRPSHTALVALSDNTQTRDYGKIDGFIFSTFEIRYESGENQIIVPGHRTIPYYSNLTVKTPERTQQIKTGKAEISKHRFPVCGPDSGECFGWIGPIPLAGNGSFQVRITGTYFLHDGTEAPFSFRQDYRQEDNLQINTGWNRLGSA